jgi:putative addiction module killer protein
VDVLQTKTFRAFYDGLRDPVAKAKIATRLERLAAGNAGDVKPVGQGISEMLIDHGPGYRIYFKRRGLTLIIILCGGDKTTQDADIKLAATIVKELDEQ